MCSAGSSTSCKFVTYSPCRGEGFKRGGGGGGGLDAYIADVSQIKHSSPTLQHSIGLRLTSNQLPSANQYNWPLVTKVLFIAGGVSLAGCVQLRFMLM